MEARDEIIQGMGVLMHHTKVSRYIDITTLEHFYDQHPKTMILQILISFLDFILQHINT